MLTSSLKSLVSGQLSLATRWACTACPSQGSPPLSRSMHPSRAGACAPGCPREYRAFHDSGVVKGPGYHCSHLCTCFAWRKVFLRPHWWVPSNRAVNSPLLRVT